MNGEKLVIKVKIRKKMARKIDKKNSKILKDFEKNYINSNLGEFRKLN